MIHVVEQLYISANRDTMSEEEKNEEDKVLLSVKESYKTIKVPICARIHDLNDTGVDAEKRVRASSEGASNFGGRSDQERTGMKVESTPRVSEPVSTPAPGISHDARANSPPTRVADPEVTEDVQDDDDFTSAGNDSEDERVAITTASIRSKKKTTLTASILKKYEKADNRSSRLDNKSWFEHLRDFKAIGNTHDVQDGEKRLDLIQ